MPAYVEYSLESSIAEFFTKTSATREACDEKAASLVGCSVTPAPIQGSFSYTVYGGIRSDLVVQFRLQSLSLKLKTTALARKIHGNLAPSTTYHGQLGDASQETASVYSLARIPGISYLEFRLVNTYAENSEENFDLRADLMVDLARFFAVSWKAPQSIDQSYAEELRQKYTKDLKLLLYHLPSRFHPIIRKSLDSMSSIFSRLPFVLSHADFSSCNIMVHQFSGRLTGIIDWAEATICPFGQNLYTLQDFSGTLQRENGWRQYEDHETLQETFWQTFQQEVGSLSVEVTEAVKSARILGCLLTHGFTRGLANEPSVAPIQEDNEIGRYNMLFLDAYLVDVETRFEDLN
ncbi:MAG: hypothetical protein Q9217_004972 [Psora testacea]